MGVLNMKIAFCLIRIITTGVSTIVTLVLSVILFLPPQTALAETSTAKQLVKRAMDHWRGLSSYSEMTLTIHRANWQRSMTIQAWSEGDKRTLVRVTTPKKDMGNGSLLKDGAMWTYSPKINRIIKIPSSMMSQSWMGSDFSNKDISKSTDLLEQYHHKLIDVSEAEGHKVYTIEAIPLEDAATVWGKEILKIRDDNLLLEEQYWDQDGQMVKVLQAREIAQMGGRSVARILHMGKLRNPQEWTEMEVSSIVFDLDLPAGVFTLSNLRNPR